MATTPVYGAAKRIDHELPTMLSLYEQKLAPDAREEPPLVEPPTKVEREQPREPVVAPKPVARALISDTVSQRVMAGGQATFLACYRRALKRDPLLGAVKVTIEADVDPTGVVTNVRTDSSDRLLSACFGRVVQGLAFPAPDEPAVAKLVFIAS
jgi:hypothetical protein